MFKLLSSLAIVLIFSGGVLAQDWAWRNFSPKGKSWTILSPGEMKPDEEALASDSKMGSWTYGDFYGFFAVVYRDAPKTIIPFFKPDQSAHFKKVKADFVNATKGQIIKETEFQSGRAKGREVILKIPSGTITGLEGQTLTKYRIERLRMFFIGRRFFMVMAVLPEDIIYTAPIDKYFESFSTNSAPVAASDSYATDEDTPLRIDAGRGVLANDTDEEGDDLNVSGAKSATPPSHGTLSLNRDGSFSYTPEANFNGTDSFTYMANDGIADSDEVTVIIKVNSVNDAPTLTVSKNSAALDELTPLNFSATANDIDSPLNALRYSLSDAPAGAAIDPVAGLFRWTPSEAQGPGNFTFRVNVSDGLATTSQTVTVTVNEVNVAPTLSNVPAAAAVNELTAYTFAAKGSDTDIPNQPLTYSLIDAPSGASINPTTGAFTWSPTERQGNGSVYSFTVRVSDGTASADVPVKLTALEVNSPPILSAVAPQTVDELKPLSISLSSTDTDDPVNTLTYALGDGAPSGMTIDSRTGAISWTPSEAQGAGDFPVTVKVTDNGSPSLSDTRIINIRVNEINVAPRLADIGNKIVDENTLLTFTTGATDTDLPANALVYSLVNAPSGASIEPSTGVFSWTPSEAQGAGEYPITVRVTDNGTPSLSDSRTFNVRVNEVNVAPRLSPIGSKTVDEETPLSFNAAATDSDLPVNSLTYSLVNAPAGATINASTGAFTWTPTEAQGAGTYNVTVRVTDNGSPALSAEETVTITVREVNIPPVGNPSEATGAEDQPLSFTLTATDADLPANKLTFSVLKAPANGSLSGTGANLTYTPKRDFNGSDSFTFIVNDGTADSRPVNVSLRITPVNDAPTANSDSAATRQNVPVIINVIANDSDVDGDALVLSNVTDAVGGTVEIVGGGVRFTPNKDFRGSGSFKYTVSDGQGGTATGSVIVSVSAPEGGN
jgi:VCBS repeat-containing protein